MVHNLRTLFSTVELPRRVRRAISAQQESSEILIGWVQLAILVTFAVLYALSPASIGQATTQAPEPWFLVLYLVFTLLRLLLAYQRRLPAWFLYLSTVLDMGLLLALIWSIHLKYGQPASFYLKAPTLLYVFIFISLRALRFEVRYVVVAGIVAALGWLLMVLYVVTVDPRDPMITRNYIEYLTSNSVLLGAEFDKVISILMVTGILAVAIARARRLLEHSVAEQLTTQELSRFVPSQVVQRVSEADEPMQPGEGEVRPATILFMDIQGFTSLSEAMRPTEVITTLNEYFAVVSEPIQRFGGMITQFQGDGILAVFNLPDPLEEHADAAIRAASCIQRILADRRFAGAYTLTTRIGINTGEVVGGLVGTGERLSYTVHGDAVNLAARLEQMNKAYGTRIIVSASTKALATAGDFTFTPLGQVEVRGRSAPVDIFSVAEDAKPSHEASPPPGGTPQ